MQWVMGGILLGFSLLEAAAYTYGGNWEIAGLISWSVIGIAVIGISLWLIGRQVYRDRKTGGGIAAMVVLIIWTVGVSWGAGDFRRISGEGAQQAAEVRENIRNTPGARYTQTGFLGYPMRQYYLIGLPTLVFGASPGMLAAGYIWPLILGLGVMYTGWREWISGKYGEWWVVMILILLAGSPYVMKYAMDYEQAILPLALTMLAGGWWLIYAKQASWWKALGLAWSGSLLGTSYTPALAGWGLVLFGMAGLVGRKIIRKKWAEVWLTAAVIVSVTVFGSLAFSTRTDILSADRIVWDHEENMWSRGMGTIAELKKTDQTAFWGWGLGWLMAGYVVLLAMFPDFWLISTVIWSLVTVAGAVMIPGYADPTVTFALHRALPVLPILWGGLVWRVYTLVRPGKRLTIMVFLIVLGLSGKGAVYGWTEAKQAVEYPDRMNLLNDMVTTGQRLGWSDNMKLNMRVETDDSQFMPMKDWLVYFYPQVRFEYNPEECTELAGTWLIYSNKQGCAVSNNTSVLGAGSFSYILNGERTELTRMVVEGEN